MQQTVDTSCLEDIYLLKNTLSQEQILWLRESMETLRNDPAAVKARANIQEKKNKLFMIQEGSLMRAKIEALFRAKFPVSTTPYIIHSANFYEIELPYGLHCDNLGEGVGFYQAVIPLGTEPDHKSTYTILFNQTSSINTEWVSPVYKKAKDYKPFHNIPIFDANWFGNWSEGYKISEEDGVKYWGETWNQTYREAYKGFSIKYAYPWSVGDVFIFNSQFTHCASELRGHGITKKYGLLLCLKKQ